MVEVDLAEDVRSAREMFPRGLAQPKGGYRFSMDALLLASYARAPRAGRAVDLGAGCGVAGLGLLLRFPDKGLSVTAVDLDAAMVEACRENAARLGLGEALEARRLSAAEAGRELPPQTFDLAAANPPYRAPGAGRICKEESRVRARFEVDGDFAEFAGAAARLLRQGGRFVLVHLSERLGAVMRTLSDVGVEPKRARFIHSRLQEPSKLVLLEGKKGARPGLRVEPPLVLYEGAGQATRLTEGALAFCSFLGCNLGKKN
jgi:tRNA1Val (adenine37-N6)-methyltransferase